MGFTTTIIRLTSILNILNRKPYSTFDEIVEIVNTNLERQMLVDDSISVGFTERTFQRDRKNIEKLFGCNIEYDSKEKGYFISNGEFESSIEQMVTVFETINALKLSERIKPFLQQEKHENTGSQHLTLLIGAIEANKLVRFEYQKHTEEIKTDRRVIPLLLKEFKYRWYLIGMDLKDQRLKAFGLSRMSNLKTAEKHHSKIHRTKAFAKYKHAYGVIAHENTNPSHVVLEFSKIQAKYIQSRPLHSSQKTIEINETKTVISLCLYPTLDFIMELLSFGAEVKVIEPEWLANDLIKRHRDAISRYSDQTSRNQS